MNLKDPKTKKIIVIAAIVIVILVVIFFVYKRNKKKKAEKNQKQIRFQQQQPPIQEQSAPPAQQAPKMQIVPEEDKFASQAPEPALSVEQVIQTSEKPKERPPVSNGNMGAAPTNPNVTKKPAAPVHSSLPPEFMTNANDPNAG